MYGQFRFIVLFTLLAALCGCSPKEFDEQDGYPPIFPDYTGVTVPEGSAPLTFRMEDGRKFRLEQRREGDTLWTTVKAWRRGARRGTRYAPFPIIYSHDPIDPYIVYRLIEPGYESWRNMGLYQRELSSYDESPVVTNRANNLGCVNCHTFDGGSPERMLFHARGRGGGTVFADGDNVKVLNLTQVGPHRQGTYPAWHSGVCGHFSCFEIHVLLTSSALSPPSGACLGLLSSDFVTVSTQVELCLLSVGVPSVSPPFPFLLLGLLVCVCFPKSCFVLRAALALVSLCRPLPPSLPPSLSGEGGPGESAMPLAGAPLSADPAPSPHRPPASPWNVPPAPRNRVGE